MNSRIVLALSGLLLLAPACFQPAEDDGLVDEGGTGTTDTGESTGSSETTTTESTTTSESETGCSLGSLDCACDSEGGCEAGLACVADVCVMPECGNGVLEGNELCDDGNTVDDDACSNVCVPGVCGDGLIQQGEECDDANAVDDDACSNSCILPVCGDGLIQQGEFCDDGNTNNFDECNNMCVPADCGDGTVAGVEECDDGNFVNNDNCTNGCKLPFCGDGIKQANEQCDDGNMQNGDACSANCQIPPCQGLLFNPGNGITGCWYTSPAVSQSCNQVCANHGGFNGAASQHTGNQVGMQLWPAKTSGGTWMSVECSSTDNNTNWGATGAAPDPSFTHPSCHVNCACNL